MARSKKFDYDILIIGGGQAGIEAARSLAGSGKRIAIAEAGRPGGRAVHGGDISRYALLTAAKTYRDVKDAGDKGIRGGTVGYNYPTLREWMRSVTTDAEKRYAHAAIEDLDVTLIEGTARFIDPHTVSIDRRHVTSASFIIAAGSEPIVPGNITGLSRIKYLTPETAADLMKPPKSVFIIGGGKTGVEYAQLFGSFGSKVTIAEIAPRLLPREDSDAGELVGSRLSARGDDVLTSTRIVSVVREALLYKVVYLRGDVEHVAKVEHVLLAAGVSAITDLGLENAEVEYTPLGISVAGTLQTSAKHIYAAGSCAGSVSEAGGARAEGRIAALNLTGRDKATVGYADIPRLVHAGLTVASVGVNESDMLRKDIAASTRTSQATDSVVGTTHDSDGFVRMVADKRGTLIGATFALPDAEELIAFLSIAISTKMTVSALAALPTVFGSYAELVTETAALFNE